MHHRKIKYCGCATPDNTDEFTMVMKCPCGAVYLKAIVGSIPDFTCYDCKRMVHVWEEHRGLKTY